LFEFEIRLQRPPDPLQVCLAEGGAGEGLGKQGHHRVKDGFVAQASERVIAVFGVDTVGDFHAVTVKPAGNVIRLLERRVPAEQRLGHGGQPWAIAIVITAGGKAEFQVNHGQAVTFDKQHAGALFKPPGLDERGGGDGFGFCQFAQRLQRQRGCRVFGSVKVMTHAQGNPQQCNQAGECAASKGLGIIHEASPQAVRSWWSGDRLRGRCAPRVERLVG